MKLDSYLPFFLATISYRLARSASREFPRLFGINQIEWQIMAIVAANEQISASAVSDIVGLDKAAVSRGVRHLEEKGFISLATVQNHNRKRLLALTASGFEIYDKVREFVQDREKTLLSGLSEKEISSLLNMLGRIRSNSIGIDIPVALPIGQ